MPTTNPNWPRLQALWAPAGHIGYGPSAASYEVLPWVDITPRLIGPWQINRGRQYELDQITTGTWSGILDNRDGLFDPDNTASAVSGDVVPYQPFRIRAQWPVTANLLSPGAAGGEQGGLPVDPAAAGWAATSPVAFDSIASATAFTGSRVIQAVVPPSISGTNVSLTVPVTPGAAYSFSIRIRSTAGTAPQAAPTIGFFTATGTFWPTSPVGSAVTVATGTGWTTLTVSGTAPALLGYAAAGVQLFGPTSAYTVQLDGAQFEQAAAPTGYVAPGIWYPLFTGGIERYPQTWRASGTLGYIQATAVDALALLSQSKLDDPFIAAAFKPPGGPTPTFAYRLSDSSGSFLDATGQRAVAQLNPNLYGAGTPTPGSPVTSTTPGGTFVCPTGMTVVNLTCDPDFAVPGGNFPGPINYIRIPPSNAGAIGPGSAGTGFTRVIAFRLTAAPVTGSAPWMATSGPDPAGVYCSAGLLVNPDLSVSLVMTDHTHQTVGSTRINLGSVDVGNWHLCFFWMSADGASWGGALDDNWYPTTASPPYAMPFGAFRDDLVGAGYGGYYLPDGFQYNLQGDVALAIEWPGLLTENQIQAIHEAWQTGWGGDATSIRFEKVLSAAGWNGPTLLDDGVTESMSPATDIADTDAVTALQAVTDTEGGVMFADAAGNMVFQKRTRRWSPAPATVVFGENAAAGELPYEDQPVFDYDPTLVTNLAEVTHSASGVTYTATDLPSQVLNGVRDRQVISQATSPQECQDKAAFLTVRYKVPRKRVASMTLVPSANPAMWPVLLGLDIGSRAKAIRRPAPPAGTVTVDGFVENIGWSVDVTSDAALTVQISPADPTPYGVFDSAKFGTFVFGY